jgi:hypothetical protein
VKKKPSSRKRQKPISLHPLSPDEALRAALQTPPPKGFFMFTPPKAKTEEDGKN